LMASSDDTHLYGWEAFRVTSAEGATPPPCWALEGHTNRVSSLVVSPNGQAIASGGWDGLTKIWC
jgi:WD40 repeat protein